MELNSSEDFDTYLKTLNYLVVYPDKTTKFYKHRHKVCILRVSGFYIHNEIVIFENI